MKWNRNNKFQEVLYWFLSCTWGIVMTFIGAIAALFLIITGHKPKKFGWDIYFNVGKWWGGVSFGPFFFTDSHDVYHTKCHEHGHGFQNVIIGPLFPLLVGIPSSIRYWLRESKTHKARIIYSGILSLLLVGISVVGMVFGSLYCFPLKVVSITLFFYFSLLSIWLFEEMQKHKETFPDYDDFYPEGNATKTGEEFMK